MRCIEKSTTQAKIVPVNSGHFALENCCREIADDKPCVDHEGNHFGSIFEIIFYETESGQEPAMDFIRGLEPKMKAKMLKVIDLLEKNGQDLRMPYSESLGDGIFELR